MDQPWKVKLLEVTTGEPPPAWETRCWEYPLALFAGYVGPGERVAEMLRSGSVEVCGVEVGTAKDIQVVSDERRQSGAQMYSFQTLAWPADEWKLSVFGTEQVSDPPGHMISDGDAPSFVNFYAAASSFFRRGDQPTSGTLTQDAMYRHQDRTGRFNSVRMIVAENALELEIEGDRLAGLVVELAGVSPGPTQTLAGQKGAWMVTGDPLGQLRAGRRTPLRRVGTATERCGVGRPTVPHLSLHPSGRVRCRVRRRPGHPAGGSRRRLGAGRGRVQAPDAGRQGEGVPAEDDEDGLRLRQR